MPIYAYKCESCGFAKDVLQKMSDARLTVCPSCGASSFTKQLTSAGFQLKGSGWYATDFKGGAPAAAETATPAAADSSTSTPATPSVTQPSESATAKSVAAPAATAAGGCAGGCACH